MRIRQLVFVRPVPVVVAEELGLFASAGLSIESRRARSSDEQVAALRSGTVDVVVTAMDNVFGWNRSGADVRIIAQVERTTPLTVYARPGHRSLADLDGGTFAVDAVASGFAIVARTLLSQAGAHVTYVETGGVAERLDALVTGAADGTLLGPPFDTRAAAAGMVALTSVAESLPSLPGQGLVVRAARSAQERAGLTAYLAVLAAAVTAAEAIGDDDGTALLEQHGFPGDAAATAWRTRPRSLAVDPEGLRLLEVLRERLDLIPDGYAGRAALHDGALLARP